MRNRIVVIMLLPIVIFLWVIGWSLFWIGSQTKPHRTQNKTEIDRIEIITSLHEEYSALESE